MHLDARTLTDGARIDCDLCVIGAGPAGLSVALELRESGADVLLLESGGTGDDPRIQELNDGRCVAEAYAGLRATRHRGLGGTANLWNTEVRRGTGAKYVSLDPTDFEPPTDMPLPGWPIDYAILEPYYHRAQSLCGLGPFTYRASDWERPGRTAWSLQPDAALTSSIYQLGAARLFTDDYVNTLRAARTVRLCDHATVVRLNVDRNGTVLDALARSTTTAVTFRVVAKQFVLAAGAIENARLLLVSCGADDGMLANAMDWAGRCFMEHPRDTSLVLTPSSRDFIREAQFYDAWTGTGDVTVCGRLGLRPDVLRRHSLPNLSVTVQPYAPPVGVVGRLLRPTGLWRKRRGYGWSQRPDTGSRRFRFQLLINLEQRPRPDNRVTLAPEKDRLGLPRAALHWTWNAAEQSKLDLARSLIKTCIEDAGLGSIEMRPAQRPDPNAHHHAGTTRMADSAQWGVVDSDGRVHGTANLYVTGASVFPTAGFANPTLTIVALAVRLAELLRSRL